MIAGVHLFSVRLWRLLSTTPAILLSSLAPRVAVVLGKTLRILGHAELFEPTRKLLHCGAPTELNALAAISGVLWAIAACSSGAIHP